jgi:glucosamine--fructose-6-phosphate aminotransferase (isomerizing)
MKSARDTLMYNEAQESAEAVERQLAQNASILKSLGERLRAQPPSFIVTCARGSSDHAAVYAKYVFETRLGLSHCIGVAIDFIDLRRAI